MTVLPAARFLDLTLDLAAAIDGAEGREIPTPGPGTFDLTGFYRLSLDGGSAEIEFMEVATLRRCAVYLTGASVYLILPPGTYRLYYRLLSQSSPNDLSFTMSALTPLDKTMLYVHKALQLSLSPRRWLAVLKARPYSQQHAVGLKLHSSPAASPPPVAPRAVEAPVAAPASKVSIIIPTKTRYDLLGPCLESLRRIEKVQYEVILIDNGATAPEMLTLLKAEALRPNVTVVRHDIPFNYSRLCNLGVERARSPYLLFLNDDIEALDAEWLNAMLGFGAREDVGAVGARLLYPDRTLQHGGVAAHFLPGPGHPWRGVDETVWRHHPLLNEAGEVDAVTGACLLMRRAVFDRIGGFDEVRFPVTNNDVDLCLKVRRQGLKVIYAPEATLLHKESQSRPSDNSPEEMSRRDAELRAFVERYPDYARQSVFFPDNLRRDSELALPI